MPPLRIIFAGTPQFAKTILAEIYSRQTNDNINILAVLTNPDRLSGRGMTKNYSPVKDFSIKNNLQIYQPEKLSDINLQKRLLALGADLLVVCAYGKIIPQALLEFKYGAINVHASLLPRWRGAAPIERAIIAGDKETGIAIMQMSAGLDEGDVFTMERLSISENEHTINLSERLAEIGAKKLIEVINDLGKQNQKYIPKTQMDFASKNEITYAHKLKPDEGEINFSLSAQEIHNKTRAFSHLFGAYFFTKNKEKIIIRESEIISSVGKNELSGKIISLKSKSPEGLIVACGEGVIKLITIQRIGKKLLPAIEVVRGMRLQVGDLI